MLDIAEKLRRALAHHGEIRLALLFGSVARGRDRSESDVDVAVDAPGVDAVALASELALRLGRDVGVVRLSQVGYPLLKRLVQEAIVVREGARGAGGAWRAGAIATLETDRPWFERMRDAYLARLADEG